ncbi:zinc-ribbon domain-containing protein [Bifidobacterium miconisargentati]|uniref:zinc-ribbon domain-containing protein n=1 Tax=Bifidobacterium miconisargentati TaxID=2834437 RepID=UPI001BDBB8CA|nr:zinc ribbon domain-containing protein [Bifidobacterium miconisargentati]MBW3090669.1 zinc ribbon domain-containing protein [Bifidobacterium miconisargentati]
MEDHQTIPNRDQLAQLDSLWSRVDKIDTESQSIRNTITAIRNRKTHSLIWLIVGVTLLSVAVSISVGLSRSWPAFVFGGLGLICLGCGLFLFLEYQTAAKAVNAHWRELDDLADQRLQNTSRIQEILNQFPEVCRTRKAVAFIEEQLRAGCDVSEAVERWNNLHKESHSVSPIEQFARDNYATSPAAPAPASHSEGGIMFCPKCGAKLTAEGQRFCMKCGAELPDSPGSEDVSQTVVEPEQTRERRPLPVSANAPAVSETVRPEWKKWIGIAFVALCVLVFIVAAVINGVKQDSTPSKSQSADSSEAGVKANAETAFAENCPSNQYVDVKKPRGSLISLSFDAYDGNAAYAPAFACIAKGLGISNGNYASSGAYLYMLLTQNGIDNSAKGDNQAVDITNTSSAVCTADLSSQLYSCLIQVRDTGSSSDDSDSASDSADADFGNYGSDSDDSDSPEDFGQPEDAVGYQAYESYQCAAGVTGAMTSCSNIYYEMGKSSKYVPFGIENKPSGGGEGSYIPVDENQNGVIDPNE